MKQLTGLILASVAASAATPAITPGASFTVVRADRLHVTATGSWTSMDTSRATPGAINSVDIGCNGTTRQCIEAEAYLSDASQLFAHRVEYRVTGWNDQEVTAEMNTPCTRSTLVVNLTRKVAYKTISVIQAAKCSHAELSLYQSPLMFTLGEPAVATARR